MDPLLTWFVNVGLENTASSREPRVSCPEQRGLWQETSKTADALPCPPPAASSIPEAPLFFGPSMRDAAVAHWNGFVDVLFRPMVAKLCERGW